MDKLIKFPDKKIVRNRQKKSLLCCMDIHFYQWEVTYTARVYRDADTRTGYLYTRQEQQGTCNICGKTKLEIQTIPS
jgi:hypothetical protein